MLTGAGGGARGQQILWPDEYGSIYITGYSLYLHSWGVDTRLDGGCVDSVDIVDSVYIRCKYQVLAPSRQPAAERGHAAAARVSRSVG